MLFGDSRTDWSMINTRAQVPRHDSGKKESKNKSLLYLEPQELDVDFFLYLYTLYVIKGRTVTPLLHKLFLGELHHYFSGYNLVPIPFE